MRTRDFLHSISNLLFLITFYRHLVDISFSFGCNHFLSGFVCGLQRDFDFRFPIPDPIFRLWIPPIPDFPYTPHSEAKLIQSHPTMVFRGGFLCRVEKKCRKVTGKKIMGCAGKLISLSSRSRLPWEKYICCDGYWEELYPLYFLSRTTPVPLPPTDREI